MKIYAPVKDFNGLRNGVRFVHGVGETSNQTAVKWFVEHGYMVEADQAPEKEYAVVKLEADFDSMTPYELREWMRTHGYATEIGGIRSKEKLLEILRR